MENKSGYIGVSGRRKRKNDVINYTIISKLIEKYTLLYFNVHVMNPST